MTKQSHYEYLRWTRTIAAALGMVFGSLACAPVLAQNSQSSPVTNHLGASIASVEQEAELAASRGSLAAEQQPAAQNEIAPNAEEQASAPRADAPQAATPDSEHELELKANMKLRRVTYRELNRSLQKKAREIINANWMKPYGTDVFFKMDGKLYSGRIEKHYHEPGGKARPWGWHPGCSLYVAEVAG